MITFYDIPSTLPSSAWSVNTWKTRYSLNYKCIPYKTEWVEYPDIEPLCKKLGILPTATKADGRPHYTLPAIHDSSTGAAMADSILIAEYLDGAYPDAQRLFPAGSHALQHALVYAHFEALSALWQFALPRTCLILNPMSAKYFRYTREAMFGKKLEDVVPKGEEREKQWAEVQEGFGVVDGWLQKGKADGPFVMGKIISFADFCIAANILWLKIIWGENSAEWSDIKEWHGGRWAVLIEELQKYEGTV